MTRRRRALARTLVLSLLFFATVSVAIAAIPETNISNTSNDAAAPAVAVTSGDATEIVWQEDDGWIYHTTYAGGSSPQAIDTGDSPSLVADGTDTVHLVWVGLIASNFEILYRNLPAGGTWTIPTDISLTSGTSVEPAIATSPSGDIHVVWTDTSPGSPTIYYYYHDADTSSESAQPISGAEGGAPSVAVDADGVVHVVWQDDGAPSQIYYVKGDSAGWSLPQPVSDNTTHDALTPRVAEVHGVVYVVWIEDGRVRVVEGTSGNWPASTVISGADTDVQMANLRSDGLGNLHAVWTASSQALRYTHRQPAGSWEPPITLDTGSSGLAYTALAADASGTAHVAWGKQGSTWNIFYQTRSVPTLIGDLDDNCTVDVRDVLEVGKHWNNTVTDPSFDFNGDDQIDESDIREVAGRWRAVCP